MPSRENATDQDTRGARNADSIPGEEQANEILHEVTQNRWKR